MQSVFRTDAIQGTGALLEKKITHVLSTNYMYPNELKALQRKLAAAGIKHCHVPGQDVHGYDMGRVPCLFGRRPSNKWRQNCRPLYRRMQSVRTRYSSGHHTAGKKAGFESSHDFEKETWHRADEQIIPATTLHISGPVGLAGRETPWSSGRAVPES